LSPAGQKVMQSGDPTGDSLYYPVIQGVSPLSALPSLSSTNTQSINPYTWGPQVGPAIWSALAIGFAESISDFGVAATLAYNSNFPWPPTSCTPRSGTSRRRSR